MADFITGDAFKDDRISEKTYGHPITANNYSISFTGSEETPEPMCNTVCFLKSEDLNPKCRNLLAVSNSYICYIVKKSKLRVIHTESSKMALLQGHEYPILDLKFSKADCRVLCSIDDSPTDDVTANLTARIIIWRLDYSEEVTSKILAQYAFGAAVVQPHPLIADVWAVAKGNNVGIISGSMESCEMLKSYGDLSLNATVAGSVTDLSFSSDGKILVVTTTSGSTSNIVAFILPPVEFLALGKGKLIPKSPMTNPATSDSEIYAITCLPCGFLTASKIATTSVSNRSIQLNLLSADIGDNFLLPIQSITVTLPVHSAANSLKESSNDIKLAFKNTGESSVNLVVLCHRLSNVLVCFAVDPSRALTRRKQQPLCHATFFDLKWPVFSLDTTTIEGRNYYSDDEVEHLEVACYQVQDSKHAVHQYHFNCCSLYSPDNTDTQENVDRFVESLQISDKLLTSSALEVEQKPFTFAAIPPPVIVEVSPTKAPAEETSWDESEMLFSTEETVVAAIVAPIEVLAPLPEILRTPAVQGKSIMNMISKLKAPVKQAPPASEPAVALIPTPVFISPPAPTLLPIPSTAPAPARVSAYPTPVTPPAAQAVETSPASDHTSKETPGGVVRFMHGVLGTLFTEAPPATQTAQDAPIAKATKPIQDFEVVPEEEDGEDDWAEASAAVAVTSSTGPHTVVPSALVGREALDRALESSKTSRTAAPPPSSAAVDAGLHDKMNDLTRGILALVAGVSEIKSTTSALSARSISSEAAAVQREEQYRLQLDKATKAMKAEVVGEMRVLLEASSAKNQLEMQAFKMETTASAMAKSKETLLAITKAMKGLVEVEMKKTVEDALKSKAWKDTLLSQMAEQMQSELAPLLSQKVRETVKDTVRDTVKGALATSFRSAFESSLLPAFQAGTDRMFAQVQASFDQGMKGLAEQSRTSQECSDECTIEMSREVSALRSMVSILEAKIDLLICRPEGASAVEVAPSAALPDPVQLLQKGNVLEAVECALELRDISKLVTLLGFMTPTQLVMNCNKLVQLCTAHQLAEDLSFKPPQEGIGKRLEWMNSLIFGLLFSGGSEDVSAATHLKPVFADIGRFLGEASNSVNSQISNWVRNSDAPNVYVPTINDFKYLTIAVDGVNFESKSR